MPIELKMEKERCQSKNRQDGVYDTLVTIEIHEFSCIKSKLRHVLGNGYEFWDIALAVRLPFAPGSQLWEMRARRHWLAEEDH